MELFKGKYARECSNRDSLFHRLNDGGNSSLIQPQLATIFQFLEVVVREHDDEGIVKISIGLIGDLATLLEPHAEQVTLDSVNFTTNLLMKVICIGHSLLSSRFRQ